MRSLPPCGRRWSSGAADSSERKSVSQSLSIQTSSRVVCRRAGIHITVLGPNAAAHVCPQNWPGGNRELYVIGADGSGRHLAGVCHETGRVRAGQREQRGCVTVKLGAGALARWQPDRAAQRLLVPPSRSLVIAILDPVRGERRIRVASRGRRRRWPKPSAERHRWRHEGSPVREHRKAVSASRRASRHGLAERLNVAGAADIRRKREIDSGCGEVEPAGRQELRPVRQRELRDESPQIVVLELPVGFRCDSPRATALTPSMGAGRAWFCWRALMASR